MNYSYVMGIQNINELKENGFNIESNEKNYMITFSDDKIVIFENFIIENLENGFWNEYLGKNIVFIFKFKDGSVKKYILDEYNEKEILNLCCNFAECKFSSIMNMLKSNKFYSNNYFNN